MTPSRAITQLFVSLSFTFLVVGMSACASGGRLPEERAAAAAADDSWSEAFDLYARSIGRQPAKLEHRRNRVKAAYRSGRLPELEEALRNQLSDDDVGPAVRFELALAVAIGGEPGSDGEALQLLGEVAAARANEPEVFYRMGLIRLEQERFSEAIQPLERALELAPRVTRHRVALAAALAETEDGGGRAREVLAELSRLEPDASDLRRARAIISNLNNPARRVPLALRETYRDSVAALIEESSPAGEAVQLIEEALVQAPDCQPFIVLNGLASVRLGQLARARAAFLRASELHSDDPMAWLQLAALDEEAENLDDAEEHIQQALRADPLSVDGWTELGRIQYQRRRYDDASATFRQLLVVDGGRMLSHLWLGRALRRADQDEEAEQVYLAMLDEHPRNYEACLQLGHIYRRRRMQERDRRRSEELVDRARHWYGQALEVRPQDPLVERILESLEAGSEP